MDKRLLIIDDNQDIIEVLQVLLGDLFIKVESALNLEEAEKKLQENIFSLIILDINLNERNGAEVIKYLLSNPENQNNACPVLILSGIINNQFIEKHSKRFAGIIIKPFEEKNLIETVQNILGGNSSSEDLPVPDCKLPFTVPMLQEKVAKVLDQVKKNNNLKKLFSTMKVDQTSDDYIMNHVGLLINVATGIATKLEWNTEKTLEKFVYAAYLHDMALIERPDLARIHATAIELELMKDKMGINDYNLVFEHTNLAAKKIEDIPEIPPDVSAMVRQHHELPKENGYPARLPYGKITPLSSVFIVAHDFVDYIVSNPKWSVKDYIAGTKNKFRGPHFSKCISALQELG